ncbi:hypothetical protein Nepgr_016426 [Nepenthes gracilis]|uniref:Uncharacterized protein n=1 Tax=Nepenthes gracilis TaxID=150966 RepID=A0AAD3SMM3_NEPGR|nr:hypothetical protein Nepgr_016426 [Nepenthes gracilis]
MRHQHQHQQLPASEREQSPSQAPNSNRSSDHQGFRPWAQPEQRSQLRKQSGNLRQRQILRNRKKPKLLQQSRLNRSVKNHPIQIGAGAVSIADPNQGLSVTAASKAWGKDVRPRSEVARPTENQMSN